MSLQRLELCSSILRLYNIIGYLYANLYIKRLKLFCAHQDLNLEPTDYESVALTD